MNKATIRTIRTYENTFRKRVAASNITSMYTTSFTRNTTVEKIEKALMFWIEDQIQNRVPIDMSDIINKTLWIYENIVKQLPCSSSTEKAKSFGKSWLGTAQN